MSLQCDRKPQGSIRVVELSLQGFDDAEVAARLLKPIAFVRRALKEYRDGRFRVFRDDPVPDQRGKTCGMGHLRL